MRALPRPVLGLLVVCVLALGGCSHAGDKPSAGQPGVPPTGTATGTATGSPTGSPTGSSPGTATSDPTATLVPQTLANRSLPTNAIPALDPQHPWQDGEIKPGTVLPDVCSRGSLLDIGASDALVRTYFPGDDSDDLAQEAVAEFPDAKTTATAWTVLASFRDRCLQHLTTLEAAQVGQLTAVPMAAGEARWYLVTGHVHGEETPRTYVVAMVKVGNRIAVAQIFTTRPGITAAAMRTPVTQLLTAAAGLLG